MTGVVVWITGLPASGKSTLARRIRDRLAGAGRECPLLDGDDIRAALGQEKHDPDARARFYEALAALAALLARQGLVVLVPATAPLRRHREEARRMAPRFIEVHVDTPAEECERRDPKGLWAMARAGVAPHLPGAGVAYEAPEGAEVVAEGGEDEAAVGRVVELVG